MSNSEFERDILFLTTMIQVGPAKSEPTSAGTGFFVNMDVPRGNPGEWMAFLVSNKHVFEKGQGLYLQLHHANRTKTGARGDVGFYHMEGFDQVYYSAANEDLDISCVNISDSLRKANAFFKGYPLERLKSDLDFIPHVGQELIFVGYPGGKHDSSGRYPQLRRGRVATDPLSDSYDEHSFLIEGEVQHGSSGSPVFCLEQGGYFLAGIITAIDRTTGHGIVVKAHRLFSVLENSKFNARDAMFQFDGRS